jgi:hypothetical protein
LENSANTTTSLLLSAAHVFEGMMLIETHRHLDQSSAGAKGRSPINSALLAILGNQCARRLILVVPVSHVSACCIISLFKRIAD